MDNKKVQCSIFLIKPICKLKKKGCIIDKNLD
jgi:hypothetical protein